MFRRFVLSLFILGIAAPALANEHSPKTLRVYFVGNSVTDTIKYGALAELVKSRGYTQIWGRHMIPGAPLQWIWEHPKDGFQEPPFGHYPTALANFQWDVLSLQPFDRHLDGKDGDIVMAKNFIDLALPKSPDLQIYIYARWPRQGKDDFDTAWMKKYTGGWDNTNETKDYFERLTRELRKAYPKLKIHMVPVGHVIYELNQRMKAGKVPGYTDIKQLFADGIHLNNVGSYVVGCTYFATLYKENPKGLPSAPYKLADAKLAVIIQDVVWKVVSTNELAGCRQNEAKPNRSGTAYQKGVQDAKAAIAAGILKLKQYPLPPSLKGFDDHLQLLWKTHGVEYEISNDSAKLNALRDEILGWNDTIETEIKRKLGESVWRDVNDEAVERWNAEEAASLPEKAVKSYMAAHADPASDPQTQEANHQQKPKRPLLLMTWFRGDGTSALFYDVSQKGESYNVRSIYHYARQASQQGQLSDKNLADLRVLLPKLPKSAVKPH